MFEQMGEKTAPRISNVISDVEIPESESVTSKANSMVVIGVNDPSAGDIDEIVGGTQSPVGVGVGVGAGVGVDVGTGVGDGVAVGEGVGVGGTGVGVGVGVAVGTGVGVAVGGN